MALQKEEGISWKTKEISCNKLFALDDKKNWTRGVETELLGHWNTESCKLTVPETRTDYTTPVYKHFHPDWSAAVVRSEEWVCRLLVCWDCGFESRRLHKYLSLVRVVFCHVEGSATGWSLVQRGPTQCGLSWMWSCNLDSVEALAPWRLLRQGGEDIYIYIIRLSALRQVHILFQSKFSKQFEILLPFSNFHCLFISLICHPAAANVFFLVFPSLLFFSLSSL